MSRFWYRKWLQQDLSRTVPEDKSGWYVEAWWINRPLEKIGHFATHSEARNWITLKSTSYFVLREIESMIKSPEQSLS